MCFEIAGKARDVVDDNNRAVFAVLAQPHQHLTHGRTVVDAACHAALKEHADDIIASVGCKITATGFLAGKAVAFFELRFGRHAGVYHGCGHGLASCRSEYSPFAAVASRLVVGLDGEIGG
nr:hypothetical protein [uncultured Tateyamaria sp.]